MTKRSKVLQSRALFGKIAITFACILTFSACDGGDADQYLGNETARGKMNLEQQWSDLMQRPNIDEIEAQYDKMQIEITDALSLKLRLPPWEKGNKVNVRPGCNDFDKVDARDAVTKTLGRSTTPAPISSEQWPQAVDITKNLAAKYGFTTAGLEIDKGNYRELNVSAADGAKLIVTTGTDPASTLIGVNTGCHLRPEVKQRGRPTSAPPAS